MTTKHTTGKWEAITDFASGVYWVQTDNEECIAEVFGEEELSSGTCEGNAYLIAAAPKMLEALQAAESWIVDGGYLDDRNPHTSESAADVVHELRVAIAKATGEDVE